MSSPDTSRSLIQSSDPLDAAELARFCAWVLAGALVGALLALALTFVLTPRWEAIVQIRPGQVANNAVATPFQIESPSRIAERVNSQAFAERLKARLGLPAGRSHPAGRLIDGALRASPLDQAALVTLTVEGYSVDEARRAAHALLELLHEAHVPMYQPTIDRLMQTLEELQGELVLVAAERDRLAETIDQSRTPARTSEQFSESVLLGSLLEARDLAIRRLRERVSVIQEQLSPERTFPTQAVDQIVVPDRPAYPRRSIHAAGGAVLGAIFGAIAALLLRLRR